MTGGFMQSSEDVVLFQLTGIIDMLGHLPLATPHDGDHMVPEMQPTQNLSIAGLSPTPKATI